MKAQTRRGALVEAGANLLVGFSLAWLVNYTLLTRLHLAPTVATITMAGSLVTVFSVIRSYAMRRVFEWLRIRKAPPAFLYIAEGIAAERLRQINREGYTLAHDDEHVGRELAWAAAAYAFVAALDPLDREKVERWAANLDAWPVKTVMVLWPWNFSGFKPTDRRRDLEKAGALGIAEIGRLDRVPS